eukprot:6066756-Pleurochrysis_carterae.AAC.4
MHSHSSEVGNAEGGCEEDDSSANSDNAESGSPVESAEGPTPADKPDDTPQADESLGQESSEQTPTDEPGYEVHFHQVQVCQTLEVCPTLPPEATSARELPIRSCSADDFDNSTATALRMLIRVEQAEDYAARAYEITSRFTRLVSNQVAWVEIDDNGRKSVVQVRVMRCTEGLPFSRPGLGLTPATYRRIKWSLLGDTSVILLIEFRLANQRILDEIAQHLRATIAEDANIATAGPSTTAEEAGVIAGKADTTMVELSGSIKEASIIVLGTDAVATKSALWRES